MKTQRHLINYRLRARRLAAGKTESQVAEEIARIVAIRTGRELAIDGNYVSKLERGIITWPNRTYRDAFRELFGAATDAELGFYSRRTISDAERWKIAAPRTPEDDTDDLRLLRRRALAPEPRSQRPAGHRARSRKSRRSRVVSRLDHRLDPPGLGIAEDSATSRYETPAASGSLTT